MARAPRGISPKGYIDAVAVAEKLGIAKSSLKAVIKSYDDFPKKRQFGLQVIRWREDEIDAWLIKRINEVEIAAGGTPIAEAGVATGTDSFMNFVRDFSAMMRSFRTARTAQPTAA